MKKITGEYVEMLILFFIVTLSWGFHFYYLYHLYGSENQLIRILLNICLFFVYAIPIIFLVKLIKFLFSLNKLNKVQNKVLAIVTILILAFHTCIVKYDNSGYIMNYDYLIMQKKQINDKYYIFIQNIINDDSIYKISVNVNIKMHFNSDMKM